MLEITQRLSFGTPAKNAGSPLLKCNLPWTLTPPPSTPTPTPFLKMIIYVLRKKFHLSVNILLGLFEVIALLGLWPSFPLASPKCVHGLLNNARVCIEVAVMTMLKDYPRAAHYAFLVKG